jgi:hypothetical protein
VSVEDEHSGWPSTSKTTENVERIRELIYEDHRQTIHEFTDTTGITRRSQLKICSCTALLLYHDNTPAHMSLKTAEFVTNNNMVIVPHRP